MMDRTVAVLVTGATSGIGEATARRLARLGHAVVLSGRNRQKLDAMRLEMAGEGFPVASVAGDLTSEEEARAVATEATRAFGKLGALVHSAGIFRISPLEEMSAEDFRSVLDTNLLSLFHLLKVLLPHFYEHGAGHVVAISSIAGRVAFPCETAYCASKWGLMGFLASLRMEAERKGVRVTAIMPGATLTPEWDGNLAGIRQDRMLSPEDVADAVAYALGQPENACVQEVLVMPSKDPFEANSEFGIRNSE